MYLSLKKYFKKVLKCFEMQGLKSMSTSLTTQSKLSNVLSPKTKNEGENMSHVLYASVVGNIRNVIVCTRPDISHAVSMMSRYMNHLGKIHR